MNDKTLYKIYFCMKSTGFVVPVFFVYLQEKLGLNMVQILFISSIYNLLPFIFEVPLGYLGDKLGNKKIVLTGILAQIFSFLALIAFQNNTGYHLYLILLYFAGAAFSGAENAIARSLFKSNEDEEFKIFLMKNSEAFYRYTILFLLIGGVTYKINPILPFIIQSISMIFTFFILLKLKDYSEISKHAALGTGLVEDNLRSVKYIFKNKYFLGIVILGASFSNSILVNHKTIQQIFVRVLSFEPYITLSIIFALGNLVSSYGGAFFRVKVLATKSVIGKISILQTMVVLGFGLIIYPHWVTLVIGYFVICLFKSLYRPIISAELSNNIAFSKNHSTILSYVGLFTSIFTAITHFGLSYFFTNSMEGNQSIIVYTLFFFGVAVFLLYRKRHFQISLGVNPLTGKENTYFWDGTDQYYIQKYPSAFEQDYLHKTLEFMRNSVLRTPSFFDYDAEKHSLVASYHGDKMLSDILDQEKHLQICKSIFEMVDKSSSFGPIDRDAHIPKIDIIFSPETLENYQDFLLDNPIMGLIHGDLHPMNILVLDEEFFIVDWDNSGRGPLWYDHFNLISSPYLNIDLEQRLNLLVESKHNLDKTMARVLLKEFIEFKVRQLREFFEYDKKFLKVSNDYGALLNNF